MTCKMKFEMQKGDILDHFLDIEWSSNFERITNFVQFSMATGLAYF